MKKLVLIGAVIALTVGAAEKEEACLLQRNPSGDAAVGPAGYVFAHMLPEDYGGMYYSISRDGLNWKLLNGGKRIIEAYRGHPDVVRGGDGKWHAIGTPRNRPKGVKQYGIHWTSTDLIRWEREDLAASVFDCSADGRSADGSLSAPKIFFDAATANYIISFHAYETKTDKMPEEKGEHRAHWRSMRTYYILTKDWRTFEKPRPLFAFTGADAEMAQIDTVIRKFGDTYYAVIKDERWEDECPTGKRIRVAKSKGGALGPYANPMPPLCPDRREAPYPVLSPDGKAWVFMEDYNLGKGRYDLYEADTPEGPWHPAKGFVTPPARHGCVFRVDDATYRRLDERLGGGNQGGDDHPFSTLRLPATPARSTMRRWARFSRDLSSRTARPWANSFAASSWMRRRCSSRQTC